MLLNWYIQWFCSFLSNKWTAFNFKMIKSYSSNDDEYFTRFSLAIWLQYKNMNIVLVCVYVDLHMYVIMFCRRRVEGDMTRRDCGRTNQWMKFVRRLSTLPWAWRVKYNVNYFFSVDIGRSRLPSRIQQFVLDFPVILLVRMVSVFDSHVKHILLTDVFIENSRKLRSCYPDNLSCHRRLIASSR